MLVAKCFSMLWFLSQDSYFWFWNLAWLVLSGMHHNWFCLTNIFKIKNYVVKIRISNRWILVKMVLMKKQLTMWWMNSAQTGLRNGRWYLCTLRARRHHNTNKNELFIIIIHTGRVVVGSWWMACHGVCLGDRGSVVVWSWWLANHGVCLDFFRFFWKSSWGGGGAAIIGLFFDNDLRLKKRSRFRWTAQ